VKKGMNEKLHKILYIALSLLLAVAFWLFVDNEQENTIERPFNGIPVEFIGAEDALPSRNLMLSGGMDATLDVVVRGPRAIVSGMKREDLRAQVNVSNINSVGTYPLSYTILTPDNIRPGEITTECSRSAVTVQVSTLYSRTLPVSVNVTGDVVDGCIYMGERMLAEPSTLTISGRAEDVDQVETVRVTVDLTGANSTIQREFDYQLLDAEGNEVETSGLRLSERRVQVTAPVFITKELPLTVKIKEAPGSLEKDARCELADQTITVAGEAANLENVDEILLGEVDLSALLSSTDIPLDINMPAGCVNLSNLASTTLSVRFSRNLETRSFTVTNIVPMGLSETQRFSRLTNSLDVLVRGPAEELENVTAEDIRIVVDLTEFASNGTYSVKAQVFVDNHDQVGAIGGDYTVACKITS